MNMAIVITVDSEGKKDIQIRRQDEYLQQVNYEREV